MKWSIGALLASLLMVLSVGGQEPEFRPMRAVPRSHKFKPITKFPVVAANAAGLYDNELVLGVVVNDAARAYPINMLTGPSREILNDQLGNQAIAATW